MIGMRLRVTTVLHYWISLKKALAKIKKEKRSVSSLQIINYF